MKDVIDAFWRATAYCLHPRVIVLSLLPLAVAGVTGMALAWFFWEPAVNGVRDAIEQWDLLSPVMHWIDGFSGGMFRAVIGPLVVVSLAIPVLLIFSLLLVAVFMGPAMVNLVEARRFPALERKRGAGWIQSSLLGLLWTLVAIVVLVASLPLWLIPPVAIVVPPLVWGWLAYRVLSFEALAEHAAADERHTLIRENRLPLLAMGIVSGYLGAAPSLAWAIFGVMALPMMPLLIPLFVWLYTLVFAFTALWFTHYCLVALNRLRARSGFVPAAGASGTGVATTGVIDVEARRIDTTGQPRPEPPTLSNP